jgi:nitrite reductase/ring-hydroxylating ferredoxin subunit
MTEFVRAGRASDVRPGGLAAFEVGGKSIAVARVGDEVYAFDDECTHRGCSLSEGDLDGHEVVCPCHGGTFDVTSGEVLDGPPPEPVATYPARISGDDLEIEV